MQFLVDINPEISLPTYKLKLHKLNGEPLASLKNITDLKISPLFVGVDNLSFNVPLYITNSGGAKERNKIYDLVEGDFLVKVNDMKYFIIINVKELSDSNGNEYKKVECKGREFSLISKKLIDYQADSRVLYDPSNSMLDGLEKGILNYIFKYLTKSWTLEYVDPDLILREGKGIHRALSFPDSNLLQVLMELQKTFNCIFTFDSINKKVSVHDIKNMVGQNKGLYISDTNFIENITKDIDNESIVTRLILRGKDNVSIQSISPTGQPYLDNFEYYKKLKYMTQGLINALTSYQTKVNTYNPDFEPLFVLLSDANTGMERLINADGINLIDKGLVALISKLNQIQILIDVKVEELAIIQNSINSAEGTDLASLYATKVSTQSAMDAFIAERDNINTFINNKKIQITTQQSTIDGIENQIELLQSVLDMSNTDNFTAEQLIELDDFIKVETFSDASYTEYDLKELKEEGIRQLNRLSQPPIQFSVNVIDFLSIVQCQHIWKNFVLGDTVTLEHKEMGFKFVVRLVGYEHSVDSHSLNLKFSNTNSYDDATLYERDLMEYINDIGTTVDFNKDKWNDAGNIESRVAKLVDSKLEESRQNILKAVGQKYLFGDNGLWLYKKNPDGTINDEQIRAINNTIALTENNWEDIGTAITPRGVVAERIYGKLGQFAYMEANQITVSGNPEYDYISQPIPPYVIGETWIDENGIGRICINERLTGSFSVSDWEITIFSQMDTQKKELDDAIDNLDTTITTAFSDASITNIEANSLSLTRDSLVKEAGDVKAIATSLEVSTTNITTAINNLNTEVNKYVGEFTYPISVLSTDRINLTNVFTALESAITALYNDIDEKRVQSATVHQIMLSNENQSIVTDSLGVVKLATTISTNIDVYRGITKIAGTIGTPILKNKDGATISFGTISKVNPTSTTSGVITWTIPNGTNISSDSGWIEIPLTIEETSYIKKLTWNKAKAGTNGYIPVKGTDYFDGIDGQDGSSNYIWVKYSAYADGTNFSDAINTYMGVATTTIFTAPTLKTAYKWTKVVGTDGVIGETGSDGKTSYLHIRYSDNGTSFTANNGETVGAWIGTYVDFIEADSSTFSKYTWNKVKGTDGYTPVKGTDYFDGINGTNGISSYMWVRYSQNSNGNPMTTSPTDAKYIGIATTTTNVAPTGYASYSWSLIKGTDGVIGETGSDGQTSYLHIKYSDNGSSFTANNGETVGSWIGTYVDFTALDSSTFSSYTWNKVRGEDGYTPIKDIDYFDGENGSNGTSSYLWIKYSANADGTGFSDTLNTYMGIATTSTAIAPTLKTGYRWSKVVGTDGVVGEPGSDGQTSYLHIKYSNDRINFTANSGETVGIWIGTYVDFTQADSLVFETYTWNKVVGEDGKDGVDGASAKLLYLSATSESMTFNSDNTPNPSTQTITFTANLQNTTGTATFTATPYNISGTALTNITLGGTGNTRTLTQAQWLSTYVRVVITATLSGLTDTITIVKLQNGASGTNGSDGNNGQNAIVGYLTNESVTLAANSSGTVSSYTGANGTFKVFDGITDKTGNGVTYAKTSNTGCTATINTTTGAYSVSAMDNDNANAIFTATYGGVTITKTLALSKSRAGSKGEDGQDGTSAKLVTVAPSHSSFLSESKGTNLATYVYTPTTITLTPTFQNCVYSKWQYSLDGTTWTDVSSGSNGLTISGNVLSVASTSALYSGTQTFIIFKCLSTSTIPEYDLLTVSRLYNPVKLAEDVGNSIKQNTQYNKVEINATDGVVVKNASNAIALQMGYVDSDGNGTKDAYGFRANHTDGSFTTLTGAGLSRVISGVSKPYNYLTETDLRTAEFAIASGVSLGSYMYWYKTTFTVTLPSDFRNKQFKIVTFITEFALDYNYQVLSMMQRVTNINYANATFQIQVDLDAQDNRTSYYSGGHSISVGYIATV